MNKYVGEIAAFGVSIAKHYGNDIHAAFTPYKKVPIKVNSTIALDGDIFSNNDFENDEVWRLKFKKSV